MKTFEEIDLIPRVKRAVMEEGYTVPTPIQAQTIPAALLGRDILGCAQTGTGKTAAYALPILSRLGHQRRKGKPNKPPVLVMAPTRELALQIGESFASYGEYLGIRCVVVYGGVNQRDQVKALNRGVHVLVATPGRLLDLMNQGHIVLDRLQFFILDEADRMLDMGFYPDLKRVMRELPERRQSLFFSATIPPKVAEFAERLLRNPVYVDVTPKTISVEKIDQRVLFVEQRGKRKLLSKLLATSDVGRMLVFTRTKHGAELLAKKLTQSGHKSTAIHGNKSQNARQRALTAFREKEVNVLVATDVAARGIDVDGITHVVNFDLPDAPENYLHRIGRTGRAGAEGTAFSFCTPDQQPELRAIEKYLGKQVPVDDRQPAISHVQYDDESGGPCSQEATVPSCRQPRKNNSPRRSRRFARTDSGRHNIPKGKRRSRRQSRS